ncbi:hypothetical protein BS50DRAFT_629517 [Corynespora cassiicola Philippines]|uniref:Uncharacterized protein n=1 Tax=Corynespora cassiicola Philippines TaxID=1448308 RepID=A0A2T2P760_CORCC|nr:hypothetical protein BS50DRAFT_629517 [Corynespora cassiicola Philippines]
MESKTNNPSLKELEEAVIEVIKLLQKSPEFNNSRAMVIGLNDLVVGTVPYILPKDLLIFKIYRCGIRAVALKRTRDAVDGEKLVEELTSAGPICLSVQQARIAKSQLAELAKWGDLSEPW